MRFQTVMRPALSDKELSSADEVSPHRRIAELSNQHITLFVYTNILPLSPMGVKSRFCGCLFFSANALARNLTRLADEEYRVTGLSPSHALLLLTINQQPGIQPKELAQEMQLTPSTVTRLLDKLESKKLVLRREEGKTVNVFSTAKGKALNGKIKSAWQRLYKRYMEVVGMEEGTKMTGWIYDAAQKLE